MMHTISIEERNGCNWRFVCTCGTTGNWYGTRDVASSTGYSHKQNAEGNPNNADGWRDDPRMGY